MVSSADGSQTLRYEEPSGRHFEGLYYEAAEVARRISAGELETPIAIGIGIHTGEAIVGRMGPPNTPIQSAIGDSVNTTSRLETATKDLGVPLVASEETMRAAGLQFSTTLTQVSLRGRAGTMQVVALDEKSLSEILN